jgi:periplasmic divalent cation tolerance protein
MFSVGGDAMSAMLVYITTGSEEEARLVAGTLIGEKLAACANIYPGITSVYEWKGEVQHDQEVVVIAKTTEAGFESLRKRVCEVHSYECPCVVGVRVEQGHAPFLQWIEDEVAGATGRG